MEGAVTMRSGQRERPRALDARTMCEAFQITAAERAGQVALRTIHDGVAITFAGRGSRPHRDRRPCYASACMALRLDLRLLLLPRKGE